MNWLSIIVGAVSTLAVGFIWYHPKVFGTIWMKAAGVNPEDGKNANMGLTFGITFIMAGVVAYNMSRMVHADEVFSSFVHGMYHGFRPSLFIVVPAVVINALFERRSLSYILVNAGYWIVSFTIMGGIVYALAK
jgi:hypothetical protein